ncbi:hypothetical protein ACJMK2_040832 [Sinanodonta woodiana]|uniref:Fucolectin tachylectin-4 pentraxin-1 domain-containing protein n=1 Tax=Sinanodonta woodiana TaxID=1069815 RepID=A0ABD3W284_SINWO
MNYDRFNALVALVLASDYISKQVDGYDGDFSVNVAYGKPANQSSAYIGDQWYREPNGFPYTASLAVDGIKTTHFYGNSCSHTAVGQSSPWWEVYLQGLYEVSSIKIYQRDDANRRSLEGFIVDGMQSNNNYFTIDHSGLYSTGNITISLHPKRQFKSIRIRLLRNDAFICLCEVEVFAEVNVALGKSAAQSSTYDGSTYKAGNGKGLYNASLAVDGNINTNFSYASCSQTTPNTNTSAWWKVMLNYPYAVIGLRIYQRTDGENAALLIGYKLFGQLRNNGFEEITVPTYQPGVINISLQQVKIFSEIKVELIVQDFRGICLCEVQVFAGIFNCTFDESCTFLDGLC